MRRTPALDNRPQLFGVANQRDALCTTCDGHESFRLDGLSSFVDDDTVKSDASQCRAVRVGASAHNYISFHERRPRCTPKLFVTSPAIDIGELAKLLQHRAVFGEVGALLKV